MNEKEKIDLPTKVVNWIFLIIGELFYGFIIWAVIFENSSEILGKILIIVMVAFFRSIAYWLMPK